MKTSLAQFISTTRELLGLSQTGLAQKCGLSLEEIQKIESGEELFLSTTIRQKLAKGLKLNNKDIKLYEKHFESNDPSKEITEQIKNAILEGKKSLYCPVCGTELISHIEKMYDLEDNLILHPKARCSKCPFQLK